MSGCTRPRRRVRVFCSWPDLDLPDPVHEGQAHQHHRNVKFPAQATQRCGLADLPDKPANREIERVVHEAQQRGHAVHARHAGELNERTRLPLAHAEEVPRKSAQQEPSAHPFEHCPARRADDAAPRLRDIESPPSLVVRSSRQSASLTIAKTTAAAPKYNARKAMSAMAPGTLTCTIHHVVIPKNTSPAM